MKAFNVARKTEADPSGQRDNRSRAYKLLAKRLKIAKREILSLLRAIPRSIKIVVNLKPETVYDYDIPPEQLETFDSQIRQIINKMLETQGDTVPNNWFFKPEVEQPVRQGTLETTNEYNRLIALAILAGMLGRGGMQLQRISPEVITSSQPYLSALRSVYVENFQVIKTLSDRIAGQVIQVVNDGIRTGLSPTQIAEQISNRFNVGDASANRIAQTEVNKAYNNAKMRATKTAGGITGLKSYVMHISALLPTTRSWHAARHMKIYTVEEQNTWWDEGSNRINCYCTVQPVIKQRNGEYITL